MVFLLLGVDGEDRKTIDANDFLYRWSNLGVVVGNGLDGGDKDVVMDDTNISKAMTEDQSDELTVD